MWTSWILRCSAAAALVLSTTMPATAASLSYAHAQDGFNNRVIGVYSAEDTTLEVQAKAGIGFAQISGNIGPTRDTAPSGAYSRTDFTVRGLAANAPLTFTWLIDDFTAYTEIDSSWGWTAFFGVSARFPFNGSYSMFGNTVVNGPFPPYTIGNPNNLVQCNGNTRGQPFCGSRMDVSAGALFSVTGLASSNDTGYIEQSVGGDGWNADFSVVARLVAVTVPDAIWFAGNNSAAELDSLLPMGSARAAGFDSGSTQNAHSAFLQWQDGSVFEITVRDGSPPGPLPLPGTLALLGLALVALKGFGRRRPTSQCCAA